VLLIFVVTKKKSIVDHDTNILPPAAPVITTDEEEEDNRRAVHSLLAEVHDLEAWPRGGVREGDSLLASPVVGDHAEGSRSLHVPAGIQDSRSNARGQAHPCQIRRA
jgi:hypothetical protein